MQPHGSGVPPGNNNDLWRWPFDPSNSDVVAGLGFWLAILGLLLTLIGFAVTLVQLAKAKTAAEAVRQEVERIQNSMWRYDAGQEVSRAEYALTVTRKHLSNSAWSDGADSYSDVRRALLSLKGNSRDLDDALLRSIDKASIYIDRFCERVDKGDMNNLAMDDFAKLRTVVRQHDQLIADVKIQIQKGAF